jgi:hypothetical protein
MLICVKIPRIIFKILNFEFIVSQLYSFYFFLITTIKIKDTFSFCLKNFIDGVASYSGLHGT